MDWHLTSSLLLLLVATALSTRLAYYAWSRRPATGSTLFTLLMLAMAQWALAYTLEITSTSLAVKLVWAKFQYLGYAILPVAWLIFVLEFTGNETWITRRNVLLLALIPASTFLLAITNEAHQLIWQQVGLSFSEATFPTLSVEYGPWFWIHTLFTYGCLLVASAILFGSWRRETAAIYRWQTIALLFGLLLPWLGNAFFMTGMRSKELTAFTFLISGVALVHYTLRFRLFDIAPVAHRAVVNSMRDGILVLDQQKRIADLNQSAEKIIGQPMSELIGKPLKEIWSELSHTMVTEQGSPKELRLGSEESPAYYEATVSPLFDWREQPRGHLLTLHDITRQKELEQMREDVTHTMVHDLRDPLSNSLFALEMLKGDMSDLDSPEGDQLLQLTFAQTMKTLKLVDKILEIGRLKSGIEMVISQSSFSVSDLVDNVIRAQTPRMTRKNLLISSNLPDTLPPAWADIGLIERVLQNLIDNSIKFSPFGGTIWVAADVIGTGTQLQISVTDEGPGITPDLREQIFDKFITGSDRASGSGLGLAFCKMAMKAHGESIWLESEPGAGARFVFSLPIAYETVFV